MRILIEPTAIMHVIGTKMDYVADRLKYAPSLPRQTQLALLCTIGRAL